MKLKLKEMREIKKTSQLQLSKKSDVARGYISQVERGIYNPTVDIL